MTKFLLNDLGSIYGSENGFLILGVSYHRLEQWMLHHTNGLVLLLDGYGGFCVVSLTWTKNVCVVSHLPGALLLYSLILYSKKFFYNYLKINNYNLIKSK